MHHSPQNTIWITGYSFQRVFKVNYVGTINHVAKTSTATTKQKGKPYELKTTRCQTQFENTYWEKESKIFMQCKVFIKLSKLKRECQMLSSGFEDLQFLSINNSLGISSFLQLPRASQKENHFQELIIR